MHPKNDWIIPEGNQKTVFSQSSTDRMITYEHLRSKNGSVCRSIPEELDEAPKSENRRSVCCRQTPDRP